MNLEQYLSNTWTACPSAECSRLKEQITTHPIPGGWAVWWRCSTCHRWHMVEILVTESVKVSPPFLQKKAT